MLGLQTNQPPTLSEEKWLVGLDLGQSMDFSAMVVLRRKTIGTGKDAYREYDCPAIHRWPLGTSYVAIVADLNVKLAKLPDKPVLVVDGTGCGRPVVDLILRARLPVCQVVPVTITGGTTAGRNGMYRSVPKRDLVGAVMSIMHHGRLHIAKALPETETLIKELRAFTAKISTAGSEKYEADWRQNPNDDVVLALALALFWDRSLKTFNPDAFFM
jgi:hypothetical protein